MIARSIVRCATGMLLLALAWAGTPTVRAADEEKPAAKKETPEGVAKKAPADYRGPVPFYYAKVLSPSQKEKVYDIQAKYDEQLKPLMAKIKELQSAREKEIEALLSPEQLKELEEIRAQAIKSRAKPEGAKPAEGDAPAKKAEAAKE